MSSKLPPGVETLREAEERLKTGNGLTDWLIDRVSDSVQSDGRGGTKTTGGWGWIGDRFGLDSTEIRTRRGKTEKRRGVESAIGDSGRTETALQTALGRPLRTEADVKAAAVKVLEDQQEGKIDSAREFETGKLATAHQQGLEVLAEQGRQSSAQLAAQIAAGDRRAADTNRLTLAQMQLGQLQANNQFEIAQMNNRLQMRREDAKEARLDRKDRQAAIQQLMAGLAQMGASIAI